MNRSGTCAGLLCSVSATVLAMGFGALTPDVVMAQSENHGTTASHENEVSEIVVTATKREQRLQDVSAAISAVSNTTLADTQINTLEDLQVAVPSLKVGNDFAFAKLYVRGLGLNSSLPGLDPSVALHVDGAVVSQPTQQFASLYDLERVEVLRGPQGTLYGRNATGGSVNLVTAKPTDTFEGYARLTVGGDDLNIISDGAVSGPLTNGVQARVAFHHQYRNGFGTYTRTGQDIDNADKLGVRGEVNFDLSSKVSNLVTAEYYREDERSKAVKYFAPSFSPAVIAQLQADPTLDPLLAAQIPNLVSLAGSDAQAHSRNIGGDQTPVGDLDTFSATNTFKAELSDVFTLRSITNYREGKSTLLQDFDDSNLRNGIDTTQPSTVQAQIVKNHQFSEELQLAVEGSRLHGIVGAYYFRDNVHSNVTIGTDPLAALGQYPDYATIANGTALRALYPDARVLILGQMHIKAYALFTNFTFSLTNNFRVKAGARQSWESRDISVTTRLPAPGITLPVGADARDYSDFTPEIGAEFNVGRTLLYATYSEGFKSGTAGLVDGTPVLINPETIRNFEAGLKGTYLDGALYLALSGFVYKVKGAQFDRTRLTATGPRFDTSVENAAVLKGKGLELEGSAHLTDNFRIDFNGTLYDIKFGTFITTNPIDPIGALQGLAGLPVQTVDLKGNRPRNTPKYTISGRATYTQDLSSGGKLEASAGYSWTGDQYFTEFNDRRLYAPAYGILDANLKYTFPNRNLSVNIWGKNLTDEFVPSGAFAISTSRTITGTYLPPRQYGVTVGYEF